MIKRFNRFELKYIISTKKAEEIISDINKFCVPDYHGGTEGYKISSLYYDSPELDFFWNKIEGIKFRRKIRIRVYPGQNPEEVREAMVEIKQRINRTVQKRRLKLSLDDAYKLCSGSLENRILDPADEQVASEIDYLVRAKDLQPACIINYHRKAFMGNLYNPGLRITFDTDLRYRIKMLQLTQNAENHLFLPSSQCIMEVKVNDVIPDWVTSVLARHNCQLNRISKYCAGVSRGFNLPVSSPAVLPGIIIENEELKIG